jgi:hypothetical protein
VWVLTGPSHYPRIVARELKLPNYLVEISTNKHRHSTMHNKNEHLLMFSIATTCIRTRNHRLQQHSCGDYADYGPACALHQSVPLRLGYTLSPRKAHAQFTSFLASIYYTKLSLIDSTSYRHVLHLIASHLNAWVNNFLHAHVHQLYTVLFLHDARNKPTILTVLVCTLFQCHLCRPRERTLVTIHPWMLISTAFTFLSTLPLLHPENT